MFVDELQFDKTIEKTSLSSDRPTERIHSMAKYTEVNQNGEILYQSDSVPADLAAQLQPRETVAQRNAAMTGEKTSDAYRTFDIPSKFDNPGRNRRLFDRDEQIWFFSSRQTGGKATARRNRIRCIERRLKITAQRNRTFTPCRPSIELNQVPSPK